MNTLGFEEGDLVHYHSIIGGDITSSNHEILYFHELGHGETVAKISGKSGCVSLKALSRQKEAFFDRIVRLEKIIAEGEE